MLIDWSGDEDHPELEILYSSITNILAKQSGSGATLAPQVKPNHKGKIMAAVGIGLAILVWIVYQRQQDNISRSSFFLLLLLFSTAITFCIVGLFKFVPFIRENTSTLLKKLVPVSIGLLVFISGAIILTPGQVEKNITIRLFDKNKVPISQGEVKIYLPEYIRSQSVDNVGQALFTGIPPGTLSKKMQIEITSPGYAARNIDTILRRSKTLDVTLALSAVIFISGKVKTAAEYPIRGVEVNVDGTRYYAVTSTDGSYNLRLEEYTLGDEVTITASHRDFEDKIFPLRIQSPNMQGQDIFLNPLTH